MKSAFIDKEGQRVLVNTDNEVITVHICNKDFEKVAAVGTPQPLVWDEKQYHQAVRDTNKRNKIKFVAKHSTTI